jgi:SAM-dependent methyltransferase
MPPDVEAAYSRQAADYIGRFGTMASVHPSDLQLVSSWAAQVDGPILDAGCGPGHWTFRLKEEGNEARGVDRVPAFIDHARTTYRHVRFDLASIDSLPDADDSIGGILAWYSLIHHEPSMIHCALNEFARVLRPGGSLLVGFFVGPEVEEFDHAIVAAYRWSPKALAGELRGSGFEVIETHTRTGFRPKPRPHGAIVARLTGNR